MKSLLPAKCLLSIKHPAGRYIYAFKQRSEIYWHVKQAFPPKWEMLQQMSDFNVDFGILNMTAGEISLIGNFMVSTLQESLMKNVEV